MGYPDRVAVAPPPPPPTRTFQRLLIDARDDRRFGARLPPGPTDFSLSRTRDFGSNPLPILLDAYREYGPVFSVRILHARVVFMLGPEANHYVTVSHASNFRWRDGGFGDLIPLLGDGMLTIDGEYHRRARRIMLPAFHREQLAKATEIMVEEAERGLEGWRPGQEIDLYAWTRALALRVALRALVGVDPDRSAHETDMAREWERALSFYSRDYLVTVLRGPRTPWGQLHDARRRLDRVLYEEIAIRRGRRRTPDILSLLMDARDDDGSRLSDQELRDQIMTLLFAGHDTTTSTVAFLFYELARNPGELAKVVEEHDTALGGRLPNAQDLVSGLPRLEMAIDETLRLYPPAWIGPRRAVEDFEFAGHVIPGGAGVSYCSWASHHIPEVFPEPEAFVPDRFWPENRAALPKGAYVPFGGGSRTCIGMRFGQLEIKAIASAILRRYRLELLAGHSMSIRQMPTLSPRGGLPMVIRERESLPLAA